MLKIFLFVSRISAITSIFLTRKPRNRKIYFLKTQFKTKLELKSQLFPLTLLCNPS